MVNAPESQFRDIPHFTPSAGFGEDQLDPRFPDQVKEVDQHKGKMCQHLYGKSLGGKVFKEP